MTHSLNANVARNLKDIAPYKHVYSSVMTDLTDRSNVKL